MSNYKAEYKKGDVLDAMGPDNDKEYICIILNSFSADNKISDFYYFHKCILSGFEDRYVYFNAQEIIDMIFEKLTRFYICLYGDKKVLVESEYPETEHRIVGSIIDTHR